MSGQSPSRLTPPPVDMAIGTDIQGAPVLPTFYFSQFLQRLMNYIGQPSTSPGGASSETISSQLASLGGSVSSPSFFRAAIDAPAPPVFSPPPLFPAPVHEPAPRNPAAQQISSLSDASIQVPTDGQLLIYDAIQRAWKNASVAALNFAGLPTSPAGLTTGQPWNNGGVLSIAP